MNIGHLKSYMKYMNNGELSVLDGVIFYGNRILVTSHEVTEAGGVGHPP